MNLWIDRGEPDTGISRGLFAAKKAIKSFHGSVPGGSTYMHTLDLLFQAWWVNRIGTNMVFNL